jgi:hypothetical protein
MAKGRCNLIPGAGFARTGGGGLLYATDSSRRLSGGLSLRLLYGFPIGC